LLPIPFPTSPCGHGQPLLLYFLLLSDFLCLCYSLNSPPHALNKLYSIKKKKEREREREKEKEKKRKEKKRKEKKRKEKKKIKGLKVWTKVMSIFHPDKTIIQAGRGGARL
jgi:cytochrome c biogenesis protein ResB